MIVAHLLEVVIVITLRFVLKRENMRRDKIQSLQEGGLEGRDLDATAFSDMTVRCSYQSALNRIMFHPMFFADCASCHRIVRT